VIPTGRIDLISQFAGPAPLRFTFGLDRIRSTPLYFSSDYVGETTPHLADSSRASRLAQEYAWGCLTAKRFWWPEARRASDERRKPVSPRRARAIVIADIDQALGPETVEMVRASGSDASFISCDVADDDDRDGPRFRRRRVGSLDGRESE
jgi:hypothetical protein